MFRFDRDQRELDKARKQVKEVNKKDDAYRKTDAFKKLSEEEKHNHDDDFYHCELGELNALVGELETKIFLKEIRKYGIPVPKRFDEKTRDKYWDSNFNGEYRELSDEGYHELRKMLREEKKARREERILWWVPIIATISGLIGTLVGVISVLRGWK